MSSFGQTLREAREAQGLTCSQIAEQTHILVQTIIDMENEDFHAIPAAIYGRGFVRLYAQVVGLDPLPLASKFMELYNRQKSGLEDDQPFHRPTPKSPVSTPATTPTTGTVPPIATHTEPTSSEIPPISSIFATITSGSTGTVPTTEPPATGTVPTTEPTVTGTVPTTEPTTMGTVPETEPTATGTVPTTEPMATGTDPTTEPTATGTVPTTEPTTMGTDPETEPTTMGTDPETEPTTMGTVPEKQPAVVEGLDLFDQATTSDSQPTKPYPETSSTEPQVTGTGPSTTMGTGPATAMGTGPTASTETVTGTGPAISSGTNHSSLNLDDSPYLPTELEDTGSSTVGRLKDDISDFLSRIIHPSSRNHRHNWRKVVLALAAIAVITVIVFSCVKLYQLTAVQPAAGDRPQPANVDRPRSAEEDRSQSAKQQQSQTTTNNRQGANRQQRAASATPTAGKSSKTTRSTAIPKQLKTTGQKVPSLYVD